MNADEIRFITASNIYSLRTQAGLTQAELGARLNYSDKSVSKWERAESIPDACVLVHLSEIFGVSVDWLLSSHDGWKSPEESSFSPAVVIAVALLGAMTACLTAFIIVWILGTIEWKIFIIGFTVCSVTYLVLDCVFYSAKHIRLALVLLIVSVLLLFYFIFYEKNLWQLFILAIPFIAIALLSTFIGKNPKKVAEKIERFEDHRTNGG